MSASRRAAGMAALHAEWTKLRTTPGTFGLLLATVALTMAVDVTAVAGARCEAFGCAGDPAKTSLVGVTLGQAVIVVLAVFSVSGEYSTGMIRLSLAAMPRRGTVLAAKAVTVTAAALVAGTGAVLGSVLIGRLVLPGEGFTAGHGYPPLSLGDGPLTGALLLRRRDA